MNTNDELVMKLIHYFITDQNYNPIVLHGAKNEIWLENLDSEYDVVRIVSNYIHNDEQLKFDLYKTKQITKKIKAKTFSPSIRVLNIFINLGENVNIEDTTSNMAIASIKDVDDLVNYKDVINIFPNITKKTTFKEKGNDLIMKISKDLNDKTENDASINEDVFAPKKAIITYIIIAINTILFLITSLYSNSFIDGNANVLALFGGVLSDNIIDGEYYRLVTGMFLHAGIAHFIFNNYALYVIGPQLEGFFGKTKFLIIYLGSGILGNLMSAVFLPANTVGIGASGAIFGLMGALLYFGYHYRLYLGTVLKSQIIPLIIINLLISFMVPGIDISAHIGGLIGGILISMAVGIKHKSTKFDITNGIILVAIYTIFLIYMAFVGI